MSRPDVSPDFYRLYPTAAFRWYVRIKLATDPVYAAVYDRIQASRLPIADVGCGLGILPFYLRSRGVAQPITGFDADAARIRAAIRVTEGRTSGVTFEVRDARDSMRGFRGNVVLLDVLHYFGDEDQVRILSAAAESVPAGGLIVIRECLRDGSWRFRLTQVEESFATGIGWTRAEQLHFPTRELIVSELRRRGFEETIVPMWGRSPYNNYLLTFRRP